MPIWLLKTEPGEYSFDDLRRAGYAVWDGVTNPVALRNLRSMKKGDRVFVYHTGDEKSVVGEATVTRESFPDPKDRTGKLVVVGIQARGQLSQPVTLASLKADSEFAESPLVRQGRLSVVPITDPQARRIEELSRKR